MARKAAPRRRPTKAPAVSVKQAGTEVRNYTVPGLIAIVFIVLITALFFTPHLAEQASNIGGQAISTGSPSTPAQTCEVSSLCDGSKLIHQNVDCSQFVAYCTHGCTTTVNGAQCL